MKEIYQDKYDSRLLNPLNNRVLSILTRNGMNEDFMEETAVNLLSTSHDYMDVQFGYRVLDLKSIEVLKDEIIVNHDITFKCSRIISSQLSGIEGLVIFAATLGKKYDEWFKGLFNSNQPLEGYIADLIGSVAVECAADILEERINLTMAESQFGCSNRYSPGYCDWNVSEQKKLFSFLPKGFCDIELTASSLMIPIKSVSGIMGYGNNVVKKEYACKICTQENCYMNKLKAV